jgi:hypothetical protein
MSLCQSCCTFRDRLSSFCSVCKTIKGSLNEQTASESWLHEQRVLQQTRECSNSSCQARTSKVSLFCWADHQLSFKPRLFFTILLVLSPMLLCVGLSYWPSKMTVYAALVAAITLYVFVAFRDFRAIRQAILAWFLPLSTAIGLFVAVPGSRRLLLNLTWVYLLVFSWLILRHVQAGIRERRRPLEVVIAAVSLSISVYSFIFEGLKYLHSEVFGSEPFFYPYQKWIPIVIRIRVGLLLFAFVVCCIAASHNMSKMGLPEYSHNSNTVVKLGAQATLLWKEFWKAFFAVLKIIGRVSLGFITEAVVPWALAFSSALLLMWTSQSLESYLTHSRNNYLEVFVASITTLLVIHSFLYVEFISTFVLQRDLVAPLRQGLELFLKGAWADLSMLGFHVSWLLPVTAMVMFVVSRTVSPHLLSPGFSVYSFVFAVSFLVILIVGHTRETKLTRSPSVHNVGKEQRL